MRNFALNNYRSVLLEIFLNRGIRRFEISDRLKMAPASVTKYCSILIKKQIIIEDSEAKGRNVSLSVNPRWKRMLGVDIGGFQTRVGMLAANGDFSLIDEFPTPASPAELKGLISKYAVSMDGVGIGVTGVIHEDGNTLVIFPNKRKWDGFSFAELGIPGIFISTSGRTAAVFEKHLGVLKNYSNALHINIGYGIQCGLYINGELLKGDTNAAGEFGHVFASSSAGVCTCGNIGCLENIVTIPMIIEHLTTVLSAPDASGYLADLYRSYPEAFSSDIKNTVLHALSQKDPAILQELHNITEAIALASTGIVNVVNPSAISFGGFLPVIFSNIDSSVFESIKQKVLHSNSKKLVIINSGNPIYGACAGAALLPMLHAIKLNTE